MLLQVRGKKVNSKLAEIKMRESSVTLCEAAIISEHKISFEILVVCVTQLIYVCSNCVLNVQLFEERVWSFLSLGYYSKNKVFFKKSKHLSFETTPLSLYYN